MTISLLHSVIMVERLRTASLYDISVAWAPLGARTIVELVPSEGSMSHIGCKEGSNPARLRNWIIARNAVTVNLLSTLAAAHDGLRHCGHQHRLIQSMCAGCVSAL
jgi:hypothetical protein